jgi:hypothetical protein
VFSVIRIPLNWEVVPMIDNTEEQERRTKLFKRATEADGDSPHDEKGN